MTNKKNQVDNQLENQLENQVDFNLNNFDSENTALNIFKEQFDIINQLPEEERPKVLYLAVFNAFYKDEINNQKNQLDYQLENQLDYTYISSSIYNTLSNYSKVLIKLLDKTLICKKYKNWGGKRNNAGRKRTETKEVKRLDVYTNPIIEAFKAENLKHFGNRLYLDAQQRQRVMELNAEIEDFTETIPKVFSKLKALDFNLSNFKPNGAWLLRESNYTNVLNGLYDGKQKVDIWEELKEKERLRNGTT